MQLPQVDSRSNDTSFVTDFSMKEFSQFGGFKPYPNPSTPLEKKLKDENHRLATKVRELETLLGHLTLSV